MSLRDWASKFQISPQAYSELVEYLREPARLTPTELGSGSEAGVSQRVTLDAHKSKGILWRNNTGSLPDRNGVPVRFGLANDSARLNASIKSSDRIGITTVNYCGKDFGVFTALEIKKPGWKFRPSDKRAVAQLKYIQIVKQRGGIAGFLTNPDDYPELIQEYEDDICI